MEEDKLVSFTAHIKGRVQGVGFRAFVYAIAQNYPIRGWVRNAPDGSVEVVAQGTSGVLEQFQRAIRIGPRFGRVDSIDVQWVTRNDLPDEFEIR